MSYYLGVNIGGTTCSVCVGTHAGEILEKRSFPNPGEVHTCLTKLLECARALMRKDVRAVGISCGGPLDETNGVVLSPPNLPGWDHIPIVSLMQEALHVPAFLMNDANAGGLAEWLYGTQGTCASLVFLTCGTGLGSGVVINGKILTGVNGNAGEVGHIRLTNEGPIGYHKAGSFEGWGSGTGFAQFAQMDAKTAAQKARKGDATARAAFEKMGEMLGRGLAILIDTLNPARIVLGGVYMRCEDLIKPALMRVLKDEALAQSLAVCEIVPSVCGEKIGDMSALAIAQYYVPNNALDVLIARYPQLKSCQDIIRQCADKLIALFQSNGELFVAGNGGSCADAHHIAGELLKNFRHTRRAEGAWLEQLRDDVRTKLEHGRRVQVLGATLAYTTAFENDVDPTLVYAQELAVRAQKGDIFLGISTSGNAKNICAAAEVARAKGVTVIALTGKNGGSLRRLADLAICVPETETYQIQELHLPIYHTLCMLVEEST